MSITIIPTPVQIVEIAGVTETTNPQENDMLNQILTALKKSNVQFEFITNENVKEEDVED